MKIYTLFLLLLITPFLYPQENAEENELLQVLRQEMDRNFKKLSKRSEVDVFYISYRVEEKDKWETTAFSGQQGRTSSQKTRHLTIQIRLGNDTLDNFNKNSQTAQQLIVLPIEGNYASVQQILWLETEKAYQQALVDYKKMMMNKTLSSEKHVRSVDFLNAPVVNYYEAPPTTNKIDQQYWEKWAQESATSLNNNFIDRAVTLANEQITHYFVSSQKASIVHSKSHSWLHIQLINSQNDLYPLSWYGNSLEELPSIQDVNNRCQQAELQLMNLIHAKKGTPSNAPAVFTPEAAAVLTYHAIAKPFQGAYPADIYSLETQIGEQILPPTFHAIADPSVQYDKNIPLAGSYQYDEEGVQSEKVDVIVNGIARSLLLSRKMIQGSLYSNGHARATAGRQPAARISNFVLTNDSPSENDEKTMLRAEIHKQKAPFGYLFQMLAGDLNAEVSENAPLRAVVAYKVYADGRPDELVRDLAIVSTPLALRKNIMASGNELAYFSGYTHGNSGQLPVTVASPSLLLKNVEVAPTSPLIAQKEKNIQKRTRFSSLKNDTKVLDHVISELLNDSLVKDAPPVHYVSVRVANGTQYAVKASLGDLYYNLEKPLHSEDVFYFIGDAKNSNLHVLEKPTESTSDETVQEQWLYKQTFPEKVKDPQKALADFSPTNQYVGHLTYQLNENTASVFSDITKPLSQVALNYPQIVASNILSNASVADVIFKDSEGNEYSQPFSVVKIEANVTLLLPSGEKLLDRKCFVYNNVSEMPTLTHLMTELESWYKTRLIQLQTSVAMPRDYNGPVLFVGDALPELCSNSLLNPSNGLLSSRPYKNADGKLMGENEIEYQLGNRILPKSLSINTADLMTNFEDINTVGNYVVDAQGVKVAEEIKLVHKGYLEAVLANRFPSQAARFISSGHHRLAMLDGNLSAMLAPGVLTLKCSNKGSLASLKKKLIALAKEQKSEYAYIIANYSANGETTPIVYRFAVKGGDIQLVRNAIIPSITFDDWNGLVAASNENQLFNTIYDPKHATTTEPFSQLNGTPVSYIIPKILLFKQIKIEKNTQKNKPFPIVENPLIP